jgi:hypothetical protein
MVIPARFPPAMPARIHIPPGALISLKPKGEDVGF